MPRPTPQELAQAPKFACLLMDEEGGSVGDRFRAVRDGDVFWTSQGERMAADIFKETAVRCSEDGMPIVSVSLPLHLQYECLSKMRAHDDFADDVGVQAHLDDLATIRAGYPLDASLVEDISLRSEIHMLDALTAGLTDRPVEPPRERGPDPVIRLMARETRIDEENWERLADKAEFQIAPFRQMARTMLAPALGNAASLEDLRILMIPRNEIERNAAIRRWVANCGESREVAPMSHPAMPGYVTGVPIVAERDDVTLITFEDPSAFYVYVWKTTPDVVLDLGPEEDEDEVPGPRW